MIKSELISQIRLKTRLSKKEIQNFLRSFTSVISDALANGEDVRIRNFGRFTVKEQKERKYYNFRTNKVEVAPKKKKAVCILAPFSKKGSLGDRYLSYSSLIPKHLSTTIFLALTHVGPASLRALHTLLTNLKN